MMKKSLFAVLFSTLFGSASAQIQNAIAISEPTGYGQKITAVELQYQTAPQAVEIAQFSVKDRTITAVEQQGNLVKLHLSADDENAGVTYQPAHREPSLERSAPLTVNQTVALTDINGQTIAPHQTETTQRMNLVADNFQQLSFKDPETGVVVNYNLFIPKNYDPAKSYPLVMFIHDAGSTNANIRNTLWQGNGATTWASDEWQEKHPAFVLAPQFDHVIVNDQSDDPADLDATIHLINALAKQYSIDTHRLYTTGQSGGAMLSIAMNIKYPDFFTASYIVAGQWAAEKTAPMANNKLFIFVSEDDPKAYPGQNAITDVLTQNGGVVQKAVLENGNASSAEMDQAVEKLLKNAGNIYYMAVRSKTLPDQVKDPNSTNKGQAHIGTWKIAYNIDAIKTWLFSQRKEQ